MDNVQHCDSYILLNSMCTVIVMNGVIKPMLLDIVLKLRVAENSANFSACLLIQSSSTSVASVYFNI
jgi:hypothetical protein